MSNEINLDNLISEGKEIRQGIRYVPEPEGVWRTYYVHSLANNAQYETWKNKTIRFLSSRFPDDRCIDDFEKAVAELEKKYYDPKVFDKFIGILESCKSLPTTIVSKQTGKHPTIVNNITQTQQQTQQQEQHQKLIQEIFIGAIKEEITGKQLRELESIIAREKDPEKAKPKLIEKLLSFGSNVTASIVGNILTNPNIWNGL